jgi:hypothetical protein
MEVKLSQELLNGIVAHLGTRPYQEVFQLIKAIEKEVGPQLQPEPAEEPEPETKPEV